MALRHHRFNLGPLDNNSFVLWCDSTRRAVVLDVGFEPGVVIDWVRREGLEVERLLATHAHYDHVAGMREVQAALGGTFWLHPDDRPLLRQLAVQGAMFGLPHAEPPDEVHDLAEGVDVPVGEESLEVIHAPGHSPGHVVFRHGDDLWVGDVLFAGSIGRTDLPGGSFEQLEHSIRHKLFPLGDLRCWTGHGPPTTLARERRDNPYVGERANFA